VLRCASHAVRGLAPSRAAAFAQGKVVRVLESDGVQERGKFRDPLIDGRKCIHHTNLALTTGWLDANTVVAVPAKRRSSGIRDGMARRLGEVANGR
jgi:hypothetical protein